MVDPMNPSIALWVAVLATVQIILLAGVTGWITSRKEKRDAERAIKAAAFAAELRREEKSEDYARQDLVADRVAKAAQAATNAAALLVKAQAETIARTDEVARLAEESGKRIGDQLAAIDAQGRKIHLLVNSDMTAARTAERNSLKLLVIALRNVRNLSRKLALEWSEAEEDEIVKVEERIIELDQILADRLAAQVRVDEEAKRQSAQQERKGE
jgi:hypothetical protein